MVGMYVKKAYDSVAHKWLNEIMEVHRFHSWLCRAIQNLCASWNYARIAVAPKQGNGTSSTIRFNKGLPQGDTLCPHLTLCLNLVVSQ